MKKAYLTLAITTASLLVACGNAPKLTSIEAIFAEGKTYLVGDKINKDAITVKATYSNGDVKTVDNWTCEELASDYTVTATDGATRKKDFTVTFDGMSATASAYTFDGKVTLEEYNNSLLYILNGNEGKSVQNFRAKMYMEEIKQENLTYEIQIDGIYGMNTEYEEGQVESEHFGFYDNACTKAFKKEGNEYLMDNIDYHTYSNCSIVDLDDLNIEGTDPRTFIEDTRSYSYEDAEFGTVKSSFEYVKGEVRLSSLAYLFESVDYHIFVIDKYGEVKITAPTYKGLYKLTKSSGVNEYTYKVSTFATDKHNYCFEMVLEEDMVNPYIQFYAEGDADQNFAMEYLRAIVNGEDALHSSGGKTGATIYQGTLKKGSTIQVQSGSIEAKTGFESAAHIFKLGPAK